MKEKAGDGKIRPACSFKFMGTPAPPALFKYFGHKDAKEPLHNDGLKVLSKRALKATPPNEFNDPFEFSPVVRSSEAVEQQITSIAERFFFDQHFPTHPNWRNFDYYQQCIRTKKDVLKQGALEHLHNFQDDFLRLASDIVGVICFSSEATHPLMWAHYASAHSGLMIEFVENCPLFQGSDFLGVDYPVDRAKPVYEPFKPGETLNQIRQIARRKSVDWEYEAEYRVIVELKRTKRTHTPDGLTLHLLPIDPSWLRSVTFGLRCSELLRTEVARLLTEPDLKHIRSFEIKMHRETFNLERNAL